MAEPLRVDYEGLRRRAEQHDQIERDCHALAAEHTAKAESASTTGSRFKKEFFADHMSTARQQAAHAWKRHGDWHRQTRDKTTWALRQYQGREEETAAGFQRSDVSSAGVPFATPWESSHSGQPIDPNPGSTSTMDNDGRGVPMHPQAQTDYGGDHSHDTPLPSPQTHPASAPTQQQF